MSESYYNCPHCKGRIKIVLTSKGKLEIHMENDKNE